MVSFFLEIGIIITLAFVGAYVAGRFRQSVIVGYILVGILIGPNISLSVGGLTYNGFVANQDFIKGISKLGLTFLLFFTGLGFSASALKTTWKPAILLAVSDVMVNLYVGFIIGALFGWPIQDSLFLAAIIGMSSVAVAAKSAQEEKKLYKKEMNFLFSTMIVEDFISILLLTFASAFVLGNVVSPDQVLNMGVGVVIIYSFFFILALFIAPRAFHYFEKINSDELFVLFALSVVFLSSAFADTLGIPPAIGAFLVGMAFAESKLKEKLERQMTSMKDAFVAIFFVTFGMLVDPKVFANVWPIVALSVPLVIMNEVFVLGTLSYFLGFTRRAAISIGSGFLGRGEDAILFASVGSSLTNPQTSLPVLAKHAQISPFAGGFCFIMSGITPAFMRYASQIADAIARVIPESLKFAATLVGRLLKSLVMSPGFTPNSHERRAIGLLSGYGAIILVMLLTEGWLHWLVVASGIVLLVAVWKTISDCLWRLDDELDLQDLDVLKPSHHEVHRFVSAELGLLLALPIVPPALWLVDWRLVPPIHAVMLCLMVLYMKTVYIRLQVKPKPIAKEHILHGRRHVSDAPRSFFGPQKPKKPVLQPMRTRQPARVYTPLPKDALIPGRTRRPKR